MAALDFSGKTVLVTGASGGIGLAIAQAFGAHGATLELVDRVLPMQSSETRRLTAASAVTWHAADLGDASAVEALAQALQQRGVSVDVLVNNAGAEYPTPLDDEDPLAASR